MVVLSASIVFLRITDLMSAGKMFADYSLGRERNSAHRDTEVMMLYNGIF